MNGVLWENQYRMTTVCIDDYENGVMSGRLYNPYLPEGDSFHSTIEFLKKMESMLDEMKFPQSFMENRVFRAPSEIKAEAPPLGSQKNGACGTFLLRVLFRQNTSWQGAVTWVEGACEETFRSVLELLLLMDSAICVKNEKDETSKVTK